MSTMPGTSSRHMVLRSSRCRASTQSLSQLVRKRSVRVPDSNFTGSAFSSSMSKVVLPKSRSEEHTSELQSRENLVCRLLLEKKNEQKTQHYLAKSLVFVDLQRD